MVDQRLLENSTVSTTAVSVNPNEIAVQSLCKQLLKSRLFRGFYVERRYVENVKGYRDIVCLQRSEKSLDKILRDVLDKLQLFYSRQNPQMWIGITNDTVTSVNTTIPAALETCLWVEINDLAFGQYWFSIKNVRFRANEIILKIKEIQQVEEDIPSKWVPCTATNMVTCDNNKTLETSEQVSLVTAANSDNLININDFLLVFHQWFFSIKQTIYDFMVQDISKENIKSFLRYFGLFIVATFSGGLESVKFLGAFALQLMREISRFIYVFTPIILKVIEVMNKIIGGFYILLAMIWKDTVGNRNKPNHNNLEYNPPMYRSIEYKVGNRKHNTTGSSAN